MTRAAIRESRAQGSASALGREVNEMNQEVRERRAGRPRAIPEALIPKVLSLYRQGLGYRAVARELEQYGVSADWTTVRRVVKSHAGSGSAREEPGNGFCHYFATGVTDKDDHFQEVGQQGSVKSENYWGVSHEGN